MDVKGEFTFDAPQAMVWDVMHDPKALAMIVPMVTNMKQIADNQYSGDLFFRVGNMAGTFQGKIQLSNLQEPKSYDIEVQGGSAIGQVNIKGGMQLETKEEQKTVMSYNGNLNFGGRIASVGSRLLEVSVNSLIQQSFNTLNRYLIAKTKKS